MNSKPECICEGENLPDSYVKDIAEKSNDFAASIFTSNILSKYQFSASKDEPLIDWLVNKRNVTTSW